MGSGEGFVNEKIQECSFLVPPLRPSRGASECDKDSFVAYKLHHVQCPLLSGNGSSFQ
jgi:hypothetical protein